MKRLALWLARHCLMLTGLFYRYGMGVPEVTITVTWWEQEHDLIMVEPSAKQVWH